MKKLIVGAVLALSCAALGAGSAVAAPASWVVRQGDSEVWIYPSGVAASEDDIPAELRRALATSTEVWFETPEGGDPGEIRQFIAENGTDAGADLFARLPPEAAARLERVIAEAGLRREGFVHARPWSAYLQLNSLYGGLIRKAGGVMVETRLSRQVAASSVPVRSEFPSRLALLQWFAALPDATQLCALEWQVERIEQVEPDTKAMMKAWSKGDIGVADATVASLRRCLGLERAMVIDRNQAWVPRIKAMLDKPGRYVVIVGEGHLLHDPLSIQSLLMAEGMDVRPKR